MQNKALVLAFFVLVGVVLAGLVWGTHIPSANFSVSARASRKASVAAPEGVLAPMAAKKGAVAQGVQAKVVGQGVTAMPVVAGAPEVEVVAGGEVGGGAEGVAVVPVSGSLNASGSGAPVNRKSLIPGPDEGSAPQAQGTK
jgi:hypothetical protein